jgi:hypothetical protein
MQVVATFFFSPLRESRLLYFTIGQVEEIMLIVTHNGTQRVVK